MEWREQFGHIRKASTRSFHHPSPIIAGPAVFSDSPRIYPSNESLLSPLNPGPRDVSCHRGAPALFPLSDISQFASDFLQTNALHRNLVCIPVRSKALLRFFAWHMPRCTSASNPPETMSELICSGCPTLLFYNRGAANIRCSRCNRVNSTRSASQIAHLTCGQCRTTLMYPPGASTVRCATCQYDNPVRGQGSSARAAPPDARPQTVLVENPRTMNEKGKLVSNVAVGVTSWKR